jgi:hypothetical protein
MLTFDSSKKVCWLPVHSSVGAGVEPHKKDPAPQHTLAVLENAVNFN